MRRRRLAVKVLAGVGIVVALLVGALLILTSTDWGRERVRRLALDRIRESIDGEIEIGRMEGDLLRRVRLIDVAVRDRQGRPFLLADTLETEFGVRALLRRRLELHDVRVVGADVVLDEPPGEEWNYVRIFRLDDPDRAEPGEPGWGDWVELDDLTLVDSRVTIRAAWHPPDDLTPAERESAIRHALAGGTREHVVEVPGGYQNVMEFRQLDAELPRVLVAHPDTGGIPFEVARLSGRARPFSPPAVRVRAMSGDFRLVRDSLFMSNVQAVLPESRLSGGGVYAVHSGDLLLQAWGHPVAFPDLRWIYPPLPERGGGRMLLNLEVGSVVNRIRLRHMDVAVGDATVEGRVELMTGDTVRIGETDLRFARVETGLVARLFEMDFPRPGELTGRLALEGEPRALRVDGDVRFDDAAGRASRIVAQGELGVEPEARFRELRVRFAPLQAELARAVVPDLPLRGTIEGEALLTGTLTRLAVDADLALRDPRHGLSRVRLAGGLDRRGELRLDDMLVAMDPLRLDLLRGDMPELPAGATATGRVVLDGVPARALRVDGDIVLDDPATGVSGIGATGELVFAEEIAFRDLRLRFSPLQAELARTVVPDLPLEGTIEGDARLTGTLTRLALDADLALRDPRHGLSNVHLTGGLDRRDELRLRELVVRMDPLRLDLLRGEVPELPAGAAATGRVVLDGVPGSALRVDGDIRLDDPASGVSDIGATGLIAFGDELRFDDLRVRADPLRADLLRPWFPDLPAGGSIVGAVRLDGAPKRFLRVDGQLAHHHPELGVSRVTAAGGIGTAGPLEFRDLDVRFEPLDLALVRAFVPDLPLGGTLEGTARLQGSPANVLAVRGDLVHEEGGERSHVVGSANVARGPGGYAAMDVRLQPLSLNVAGRFFPQAGLRGSVRGQLRASGDLGDLRLDADLRTQDGGAIQAVGTLDLASAAPGYDLDLSLRDFDLAAVTRRAPARTDLTGTIVAEGRGLDPTTMRASIDADLTGSRVADMGADLVRLRLDFENGLARVDSSIVRLAGAEAELDGSFGLVAGREGVLSYRVIVDSLHAFAPWLPGADTAVGLPAPRPAVTLAGDPMVEATAPPLETVSPGHPLESPAPPRQPDTRRYVASDGARVVESVTRVQAHIEREREPAHAEAPRVQRVAEADTVEPARGDTLPRLAEAEPPAPPADSLAGSLEAEGTLRGNVTRFDVDGRASMDDLVYQGSFVGRGDVAFAVEDVGTPSPGVMLDAELREVRTPALAFDSLSARGTYRGVRGEGRGELVVAALTPDDEEYRADLSFDLSLPRSEVRFADLMLRFDTVTWRMAEPGVVSWADDAIEVARIDLVSDAGGRVRLDGRLPVDGSGDLDVLIQDVEVGQLASLLQLDSDARGRLNLDAHVQGTLENPRMTGTARLDDAWLDGRDVPDVRASFTYAGLELTADAELLHEGRALAEADVRLPVDLSLLPGQGPRLLEGQLAIDVRADSLPIEAIPTLSEQVEDARGRVRGQVAIRGTVEDPIVTGEVELDLGSVRIVPLDVRLEDVAGRLTLEGDVLRVDSLVAYSGGGPIRASGEIGIAQPTDPTFALEIEARETLVIDTDDVSLELDGELTVGGSLAALEVAGEVRTRGGVIMIPPLSELGDMRVVSLHAPAGGGRIDESFMEELSEPRRPLLERLDLDVGLRIDRDVWVRSAEVNVEIYTPADVGPLRIRRNPEGELALEGVISTDRGEYEFMSRRFDLTRGSATFVGDPEINPVLQIAAEHEVRLPGREAFAMRVLIGGLLRDPEITLESTAQPPIAQTDLLYYLAFGREAVSLLHRQGSALSAQGGDAGELVGNAAGLATQQLGTVALDAVASDLEGEMMQELGVDVFRITPADLPPEMFSGGYGDLLRSTEVEAGRYVSSKLFVAGQLNTGATRPGVRVEYQTLFGVQWRTAWRSRWLPSEPTLTETEPRRRGVLSSFLVRTWRF